MKRLLNILLISASLIALLGIVGGDNGAGRNDNIGEIITTSTPGVLDIPTENKLGSLASKEFSNPLRAGNKVDGNTTPIASIYTLPKRVHNISSHSTNVNLKTGSHKYISYGILRV